MQPQVGRVRLSVVKWVGTNYPRGLPMDRLLPAAGLVAGCLTVWAIAVAAVFLGVVSPTPARAQGPNTDGGNAYLFPDTFKAFRVKTSGAEINGVIGGKGPPV